MDLRPELAEAIGAFFLVLTGCGAIASNAAGAGIGALGVSLAFAFVILVLVYALGHICGAHYNPAITLAFALTGHFPWKRVPTYWGAQILGATVAALTLRAIFGGTSNLGATIPSIAAGPAFGIEVVATFLLAFVIIAIATDERAAASAAGLAIGLAVGVDAIAFGSLTGASMNPARSLGPALASGNFGSLWIYLTAPFLGAALAMVTYEYLRPARIERNTRPALGALGPIEGLARESK
ncbi:MAG: MIP/aquaporin family protein [Thermoplasmatota archaeon]